jgi:hypothetical protein
MRHYLSAQWSAKINATQLTAAQDIKASRPGTTAKQMSMSEIEMPEWLLYSTDELLQILGVKFRPYYRQISQSFQLQVAEDSLDAEERGKLIIPEKFEIKTDTLEALCVDEWAQKALYFVCRVRKWFKQFGHRIGNRQKDESFQSLYCSQKIITFIHAWFQGSEAMRS